MNNSEVNNITNNSSWDPKQVFSKKLVLNDTQLGIVYNAKKNGNEDIICVQINHENDSKFTDMIYYGYNVYNNELITFYSRRYKKVDNVAFIDFMSKVFDYVNEGKILLINNQYKAQILAALEDKKTISNSPNTFSDVDYILTKIKNPITYTMTKNIKNVEKSMSLVEFAPMMAYKIKHAKCSTYKREKSQTSYNSPRIKEKYKITLIPKDLQHKFNKPSKYFEEIKTVIELNEENGFYSYHLDNLSIPILCKHEYMIYAGKPMREISLECYMNGKCKYCGQEINAYHEQIKELLPPKIYDLIYKYMATINENIDESSLMNVLFSLVYDSIKTNIDSTNVDNYDASIVAFTALYLYVVYMRTKDSINYNIKIAKYIDSAKKYWAEIGWTNEVIEKSIKDSSTFSNMTNIDQIIREKIYTNDISFLDVLPVSIMFNKSVHPKDYNNLEANTQIQKMWKSGIDKMIDYNKLFYKSVLSKWKFTCVDNVINKIKSINTTFKLADIKLPPMKNGEKFFYMTCENYCPVSNFHAWEKNTCKYCGMKKDLSNKKDVYNKFEFNINNSYLQKPSTIDDEKMKIDKLYSKAQIEKYKAEDLFTKYLVINNYVLKQSLEKSINDCIYIDDIMKFISTLTTIEINELTKTSEFIKKSLCFIIDNHIKDINEVMNELKNIYFKIKNIDWLFVQE